MASVYAVLAFVIGSHFSEALWQSTRPKKWTVQLPETLITNQGSQRVMDELATQVSSLQNRLNQVNQKGKDSLQTQKAAFEQILMQQAHENIFLKSQNERIIGEIQNHRSNSSKWRTQAEHMALACNRLKQELHQLQANMSFAQEFAHQTLNATEKMLEAPELRFLEELTQQDEADRKDRLHSSHLMEIAGEHEDGIQMLQTGVSVTEAPQDLLHSLMESIEDLSRQQNQSLMKMKANFDVVYQKGVEVRESLLHEQTKLNATRTYERNLDDRLHLAAEHLTKTHNELMHKLGALRVFHARLGGDSASIVQRDAVSLLQLSQKNLPETTVLMREPQHVQDKLKSQIAMLAAGLAEKQQKANEAILRLKADYESQLNSQAGENERMQRKNKNLSEYAESLGNNTRAMREEAKWLEAGNGQLLAELNSLKVNISTAQEFARIALESSNKMLENATELNVLASLEAQDAAARSVRIHQERLEQVGKSPSLLQLSAAISPKDTHDVLESFMASLTDLSYEQNASEASLKATFEEFARRALESSNEMLENASELNGLAGLEAQDAAAGRVRIHQERSEQVDKSPSFLQLSAAVSPKDTHDVLEFPMASLTDLSHEQNASEASLKATFEEFARRALESSNEMLENSSELKVLASLEAQDAAARSVRIHQELSEQVGKSPSLLQLSAAISPKDTHDVLESLMASLTDLSHEQNVSEASLKASFEEELNIGFKKHQSLMEDQTNLNKTIADREALCEKLRAAVHHLQARRDLLLETADSLRTYMKKMGYAQESNKSISLLGVKKGQRHESNATVSDVRVETSKAVNKEEQRQQHRQAKPLKEPLLASAIEHHGPQRDRRHAKRKMLMDGHGSKNSTHAKHVKQDGEPRASEEKLAPNGTDAGVASGAPRWLAPIKKGISWLRR